MNSTITKSQDTEAPGVSWGFRARFRAFRRTLAWKVGVVASVIVGILSGGTANATTPADLTDGQAETFLGQVKDTYLSHILPASLLMFGAVIGIGMLGRAVRRASKGGIG